MQIRVARKCAKHLDKLGEHMDLRNVDQQIASRMRSWGIPAVRISFAIIFFWFGILKPFGFSAATGLLKATVAWLPFGDPDTWLIAIGWWEVIIGITFLFRKTTRIAIALLFLQMLGTFMPLIFLPEVTFQDENYLLPTLEGQYIIKNILIISAALIVGGTFYKPKKNK
ncbi:MAG: hypothetical protein ABJN84_03675 [Flavobacteriaceae bacterium]